MVLPWEFLQMLLVEQQTKATMLRFLTSRAREGRSAVQRPMLDYRWGPPATLPLGAIAAHVDRMDQP
jgi:hypothetical protein